MSGTASDFVWLEGSARTNLKVFDRDRGVVTEFNEYGRQAGAGGGYCEAQDRNRRGTYRDHADYAIKICRQPRPELK